MSAPAQRRVPLELVPEHDSAQDTGWLSGEAAAIADPAAEQPESWHAETVLNEWAPEHQLIGALMWLTAEQARPILELVPVTAIWQPMRQWAYEIIRGLVDEGRDPNPVVVLAAARERSWSLAQNAEQPPRPNQHHRLAVLRRREIRRPSPYLPSAPAQCDRRGPVGVNPRR